MPNDDIVLLDITASGTPGTRISTSMQAILVALEDRFHVISRQADYQVHSERHQIIIKLKEPV